MWKQFYYLKQLLEDTYWLVISYPTFTEITKLFGMGFPIVCPETETMLQNYTVGIITRSLPISKRPAHCFPFHACRGDSCGGELFYHFTPYITYRSNISVPLSDLVSPDFHQNAVVITNYCTCNQKVVAGLLIIASHCNYLFLNVFYIR